MQLQPSAREACHRDHGARPAGGASRAWRLLSGGGSGSSEVAALELAVDAAPPGDAGQHAEESFECGVAAWQADLSHLEHQRSVKRVTGHAVLAHEPVGRESVGDAKALLEARAAGPKLDLDDAAILARIAPGVDAAGRRDGLVAGSELVVDAVDLDGRVVLRAL